jgi:hypothetical protein
MRAVEDVAASMGMKSLWRIQWSLFLSRRENSSNPVMLLMKYEAPAPSFSWYRQIAIIQGYLKVFDLTTVEITSLVCKGSIPTQGDRTIRQPICRLQ